MPAEVVAEVDDSVRRLIDDMLATMYDAPGVGLAAPQVGVTRRVMVFDVGEGPMAVVNPTLVETSGAWEFEEGCLSVPDRFWPITRPAFARVHGLDRDGKDIEVAGDELLGRVLQHEVDHLSGILLLEHLPKKVRKEAMRELRFEAMGLSPDR